MTMLYGVFFVNHEGEEPFIKQLVGVSMDFTDAAAYKEMWQDDKQHLEIMEIPFLDIRKSPFDINRMIGVESWGPNYPNELSVPSYIQGGADVITNNAIVSFKFNPSASDDMWYTIQRGSAYVELDTTSVRLIVDTLNYLLDDAITKTTVTIGLSGRFNNGDV